MTQPLVWTHHVTEIVEAGLQQTRTATAAERTALAQGLDVLSCDDVKAYYRVRALGQSRYRVSGNVSARLMRKCIVTLEPIAQDLEESFEVEFRPAEDLPLTSETEVEVFTAKEVESIDHGLIDVGRIISETLSVGLDPYPRKPNAVFAWEQENNAKPSTTGPFAGLSKLKDER